MKRMSGFMVPSLPMVYFFIVVVLWVYWVWSEKARSGFILVSFPMAAGGMFIVGNFKSGIEEILGLEMNYMFFSKENFEPATRFALFCFIMLILGYKLAELAPNELVRQVGLYRPSVRGSFIVLSWVLVITAAVLRFSRSSVILYSEDGRGVGAFDRISDVAIILMRLILPIAAALAPLLSERPPWPNKVGWFALTLIAVSDMITYNRGTTVATSVAFIGSTMVMSIGWSRIKPAISHFRLKQLTIILLALSFVAMVMAAREFYRLSSVRTTGLLSLKQSVEEVRAGSRNQFEHGLPMPIGGIHTLTVVMQYNELGYYQDKTDFLFELNPLPNFLLQNDSAFWLTRVLGFYGISGFPLPIVADSYNFFGWLGCLLFVPLGWIGQRLWITARNTSLLAGKFIPLNTTMMYAGMLVGFWYGCSIMNFRPYIRMIFNTYIFLLIVRTCLPNGIAYAWLISRPRQAVLRWITPEGSTGLSAPPQEVAPTASSARVPLPVADPPKGQVVDGGPGTTHP